MHYITLRDDDTYYKMVSPIALLAHFSHKIGGLEFTDILALIGEIPGYWYSDPHVPQYIMVIDESQKKAARTFFPITYNSLAAFATSSLLLANSFPDNRPEWDGKPKVQYKWDA